MKRLVVPIVLVSLVILAGCLNTTSKKTVAVNATGLILPNGELNTSRIANLGFLSKLNKPIECRGEERITTNGSTEVENVDYFVIGNTWKMIITKDGEKQVVINKVSNGKTTTYISVQGLPNGCKWIEFPGSAGGLGIPSIGTRMLSFTTPDGIHVDQKWVCRVERIGSSVFEPEGKVCTVSQIAPMATD